ncbi:PEBP-like protein [Exidia glandulosa HHB12029]|uniref:PEBP-like protein n=1 Tax=Exidia glandulosa HHB12029 TaxID=1314781 RepID=A0A165EIJ8_EXIGL|nr:PEBP-like protein [Exidia glandulosa HHB12029]
MAFDASSVISSLQREQLIPDILPATLTAADFTVPLSISFPTGAEAKLGNELKVPATQDRPTVAFAAEDGKTYTLAMLDPDAPTRDGPIYRSFRHWVLPGLSATKQAKDVVEQDVSPWRPPGPRPASGVHRYTFLLFEEPQGGIVVPQGAAEWGSQLEERRSWDAVKFGEQFGLKLVGVNFFLVRAE